MKRNLNFTKREHIDANIPRTSWNWKKTIMCFILRRVSDYVESYFSRRIMFGRGICEKYSLETKFPSPFGSGNFSSLDWWPNMMHLFNSTEWCYIKRTTDNVLQILLQASRWRVKTANTILQIPWKKVKNSANSQCKA
jgi:hypothetical protein